MAGPAAEADVSEAFEEQLEVHGKSFLFAWSELHPPEEELGFALRSASERALRAVKQARAGVPRPCPLLLAESELRAARRELSRLEEDRPSPRKVKQLEAAVLECSHNVGEAREALRELEEPGTGCPDPESFWRAEEVLS